MEIYFDRRTVRELRNAALDAIEDGDYEALSEDLVKAFSDEQADEIEKRLSSGDFPDFINEILEEWGMDDVDSLFETLETRFAEIDIELRFEDVRPEEDEEEEEEEEDVDDEEIDESLDDDDSVDEDE
ncbi:MAG: hypothetical protein JXB32_21280 [Deltaproteobacteria bacterium]|nr:hypothetical protein [Deltaproteobacteria bacterium]